MISPCSWLHQRKSSHHDSTRGSTVWMWGSEDRRRIRPAGPDVTFHNYKRQILTKALLALVSNLMYQGASHLLLCVHVTIKVRDKDWGQLGMRPLMRPGIDNGIRKEMRILLRQGWGRGDGQGWPQTFDSDDPSPLPVICTYNTFTCCITEGRKVVKTT